MRKKKKKNINIFSLNLPSQLHTAYCKANAFVEQDVIYFINF